MAPQTKFTHSIFLKCTTLFVMFFVAFFIWGGGIITLCEGHLKKFQEKEQLLWETTTAVCEDLCEKCEDFLECGSCIKANKESPAAIYHDSYKSRPLQCTIWPLQYAECKAHQSQCESMHYKYHTNTYDEHKIKTCN